MSQSQSPTTSIPVPERPTPRAYMTEAQWRKRLDKLAAHPAMRHDNIHLAEGATTKLSAASADTSEAQAAPASATMRIEIP